MKRLWVALVIYAGLAGLAWTTLGDTRFKLATMAILAMFAIRTLSWSRKQDREEREEAAGHELRALSQEECSPAKRDGTT